MPCSDPQFQVEPPFEPILREIGLNAQTLFTHPGRRVWRSIPDRENATLDATLSTGQKIRLHIKSYTPVLTKRTPADDEVRGLKLLVSRNIPTAPLVASGQTPDRHTFVILNDLAGHRPSDKLLDDGFPFERLLNPTADLAAQLHTAHLHHRDLYLCHFFTNPTDETLDLRLIDAARVRPIPLLFPTRWIVKDLAQFWYSTLKHPITPAQRLTWLERYANQRHIPNIPSLLRKIERKIAWMARHDLVLNRKQPHRNISIPQD